MTTASLNWDLQTLLDGLSPACSERVSWRGGQIELDNQVYLTDRDSVPDLTSSGRCIVVSGDTVLVMSNPTDTHILPGGRIEPGESIHDATVREVREETGLELTGLTQVGILVYRHLTPKPSIYRYPYPVFLNAIFAADATYPDGLLVNDTYELAGEFIPFEEAATRIANYQRVLLAEAIARLARPPADGVTHAGFSNIQAADATTRPGEGDAGRDSGPGDGSHPSNPSNTRAT